MLVASFGGGGGRELEMTFSKDCTQHQRTKGAVSFLGWTKRVEKILEGCRHSLPFLCSLVKRAAETVHYNMVTVTAGDIKLSDQHGCEL